MFSPGAAIGLLKRAWSHPSGIYGSVIGRLILGVLLIFLASSSRFPLVFTVLGAVSLVGAVVIPFVGRDGVGRLITVLEGFSPSMIRGCLLLGAAFGAFLVYGVW